MGIISFQHLIHKAIENIKVRMGDDYDPAKLDVKELLDEVTKITERDADKLMNDARKVFGCDNIVIIAQSKRDGELLTAIGVLLEDASKEKQTSTAIREFIKNAELGTDDCNEAFRLSSFMNDVIDADDNVDMINKWVKEILSTFQEGDHLLKVITEQIDKLGIDADKKHPYNFKLHGNETIESIIEAVKTATFLKDILPEFPGCFEPDASKDTLTMGIELVKYKKSACVKQKKYEKASYYREIERAMTALKIKLYGEGKDSIET